VLILPHTGGSLPAWPEIPMRLLVPLLLSFSLTLGAVEDGDRERLREELPNAMTELTATQERLAEVLTTGGITVPPGVQVVISARRMVVDDWMKKIGSPTTDFTVEEVDQLREALDGLRWRMETIASLVEISSSLDDRWPHAKDAPELQRYRTYLRSQIDRGLLEVAAGADVGGDDGVAWQRQRRHESILQVIESLSQIDERWPLVAKQAPELQEYRDHTVIVRATAERGLQQAMPGDDRELDRDEAILWMLDEIVQLAQTRAERLADRQIPPTSQVLVAFTNGLTAEVKALRALIAHRRAAITDERAWQLQEEDLRRERNQRARLSGLAWEGLELDLAIDGQRRHLDEVMQDLPATLVGPVKARLPDLDQLRATNVIALAKAVEGGVRIDGIAAKSQLRLVQRHLQAFNETLEQNREREANEQGWRDYAANPAVAAALAKLEAAWTALQAARERQVESDVTSIKADIAREMAEVASEESQIAAQRSQRELEQLHEQLELRRQEVVDAVENPAPKPEGDTKF
jgi:hypothetical protein